MLHLEEARSPAWNNAGRSAQRASGQCCRPGRHVRLATLARVAICTERMTLCSCTRSGRLRVLRTDADYQSACSRRTQEDYHKDEEPGAPGESAETGRLRARLHTGTEEAEFGASKGRTCSSDERHRVTTYIPGVGHNLQEHSSCSSRRPCKGLAGRPLSRRSRHARRGGCQGRKQGRSKCGRRDRNNESVNSMNC